MKYQPYTRWQLALGTKPLDLNEWIEIDEHFAAELAEKERLLGSCYDEVFVSLPDSQASQREVLDLLVDHLVARFPERYRRLNGGLIENCATQQVWDAADFAQVPLDLAGRLVQEDLVLMRASPAGYLLVAGSVCFPSRWVLRQKLGRPMVQIHAPVPGYDQKLARPADGLFERLRVDQPIWRLNWSLLDTPQRCLIGSIGSNQATQIDSENAGERLWMRVERQTLRRLPQSGDILFTIRTYIEPLAVIVQDPEIALQLAETLQQMPPEMKRYKSLDAFRDPLLGYLAKRGSAQLRPT